MPQSYVQKQIEKAIKTRDGRIIRDMVIIEASKLNEPDTVNFLMRLFNIAPPEITYMHENPLIRTAAIFSRGDSCYIGLNADFLRKYVTTSCDLLFLILHEISHKVMGDLKRRPPSSRLPEDAVKFLMNFAADMLINSKIITHYFSKSPPPMLELLYKDRKSIFNLLCPPVLLTRKDSIEYNDIQEYFNQISQKSSKKLAQTYHWVWFKSVSFDNLFVQLESIVAIEGIQNVEFLGNHEFGLDKWLERYIKKVVEEFGKIPGFGSEIERESFYEQIETTIKKYSRIYNIIKRAFDMDFKKQLFRPRITPEYHVMPSVGRKEAFFLSAGYIPIFYPNLFYTRSVTEECIHLYLDVSGSMRHLLPFTYGLVINLKEYLDPLIYLFSNQVVPVDLSTLMKREFFTTFGTDYNCVANYALKHRHRKILIITDGYANIATELKKSLLKNTEIYVILTSKDEDSDAIEMAGGKKNKGKTWWAVDLA